MLKKIDLAKNFIQQQTQLFLCPICQSRMQAEEQGLRCLKGHRFDLSKKGTLYFLKHQIASDYDKEMFSARRKMIKSGMYEPVLAQIADLVGEQETILDVGCGEGSFLNDLLQRRSAVGIGFDIAKDGVYLATQQPAPAFWCVADLTNLPFASGAFSTILNIFSPSNYREFHRILKPGGKVIKVVPRHGYLKELRQAFYPDDVRKQSYSNQAVVEKFQQAFSQVTQREITYQFAIPPERRLDLLEMSPLEWGVSEARKATVQADPLTKITIDVDIFIGK